jgi:hypothetical protein
VSEPAGPQARDIVEASSLDVSAPPVGRRVIAVIGIDRYAHWRRLYNAVSDAKKIEQTFVELGFETLAPGLFDDGATHAAIDDLLDTLGRQLTPLDHLVLFFAGHGTAHTHSAGGHVVTTGFLIPVDGSSVRDQPAKSFELSSLLQRISRLPALHILVILDACHSGIALNAALPHARGDAGVAVAPFARIHAKTSRVFIASAMSDEAAQDSGPLPNHSVFTSCLTHALEHDMERTHLGEGQFGVHGSTLGAFVRTHIHDNQTEAHRQTPDFGRFGNDDRGDMPIVLAHAYDRTVIDNPAAATTTIFSRGSAPVIRSKIDPELAHAFEPAFTSQFDIPSFPAPTPPARRVGPLVIGAGAVALAAACALAWGRPSEPSATVAALDDSMPGTAVVPLPDRAVHADAPPPPVPAPPVHTASPPRPLSVVRTVAPTAKCYADVKSIPHGASVLLNNVKIGIAPARLELPCGYAVTLTFQLDDYNSTIKTVVATHEGMPVSTRLKRTTPRSAQ